MVMLGRALKMVLEEEERGDVSLFWFVGRNVRFFVFSLGMFCSLFFFSHFRVSGTNLSPCERKRENRENRMSFSI